MATITFTPDTQDERAHHLHSAFEIANSAAGQIEELVLRLETKYDPGFLFPADLALAYHCILAGDAVDVRVFLEAGQEPEGVHGIWRPFGGSPEWTGTVESTIAELRGKGVLDIVCNLRLAHLMAQAAIVAAMTSGQGDPA